MQYLITEINEYLHLAQIGKAVQNFTHIHIKLIQLISNISLKKTLLDPAANDLEAG